MNDWLRNSLMSEQREEDTVLGGEPDNQVQVSEAENAKEKKSLCSSEQEVRRRRDDSTTSPVPGRSHTLLVFSQHVAVSLSRDVNMRLARV